MTLMRMAVAIALGPVLGCTEPSGPAVDVVWLLSRIDAFEQELAGRAEGEKGAALASLADEMLHQRIRVRSATVVHLYERGDDWDTKPFFGYDYNEAHYLRLADLDPVFNQQLRDNRYWASVSYTSEARQLTFELAMDRETHAGLETMQEMAFTCEVAGIIRMKTVYCRLLSVDG